METDTEKEENEEEENRFIVKDAEKSPQLIYTGRSHKVKIDACSLIRLMSISVE